MEAIKTKKGMIFSIDALNAIIIVVFAIGVISVIFANTPKENIFAKKMNQQVTDAAIVGLYKNKNSTDFGLTNKAGAIAQNPDFYECISTSRFNMTQGIQQSETIKKEYCAYVKQAIT